MNGRLRHIVFPVVIVAMMVYFTYHIFQGQRGVLAWIRLDKKQLEREAYLLRPDSLDVDLLEEKARQALNFAHPNEVVVQGTDK